MFKEDFLCNIHKYKEDHGKQKKKLQIMLPCTLKGFFTIYENKNTYNIVKDIEIYDQKT